MERADGRGLVPPPHVLREHLDVELGEERASRDDPSPIPRNLSARAADRASMSHGLPFRVQIDVTAGKPHGIVGVLLEPLAIPEDQRLRATLALRLQAEQVYARIAGKPDEIDIFLAFTKVAADGQLEVVTYYAVLGDGTIIAEWQGDHYVIARMTDRAPLAGRRVEPVGRRRHRRLPARRM